LTRYYEIPSLSEAELIEVSCAVCGNSNTRTLGKDNGYWIRKCAEPDCGFVYVSPRPSKEKLQELYQSYYPENAIVPDKWLKEMNDIFMEVADWLTDRQPKGRVIDVGCSFGHMLLEMERRGWQTAGVEPSKVAADYARERVEGEVVNCAFEDAQFDEARFDALISLYVLEHVSDPRAFLQKCFDLLRSGGKAIIRVPRTEPLFPLQRLLGRSLMFAPMHLNDFSPRTMERLARDLGFRTVDVCVGRVRRSHDLIENAGALVLGTIGQTLEKLSRGTLLFPWTGSLSYRLTK
jgi:SAM-dependent methyltransferase